MYFRKNNFSLNSLCNALFASILLNALLSQCANPSNPTGGPTDTIPPSLISVSPPFASLNLDQKEFTFIFDERVTADKLKQNLVISPTYDGQYDFVTKKETFTISFDEPFRDSTTYTFNFADGITDITENNPAPNLIYVFSTGNYLDSLKISGSTYDLLTQEPTEGITVALFTFSDTLAYYQQKPKYFTKTNAQGEFQLNYVKNDQYKLLAYLDENRNLQPDLATEQYAFLPDTLQLNTNKDSLQLYTVSINADSLSNVSSRPYSKYYEIRFNKPIRLDTLVHSKDLKLYYQYVDNRKAIRFYNPGLDIQTDSIKITYTVFDTLMNSMTDSTFLKFTSNQGKLEDFHTKIIPTRIPPVADTARFTINTSKPITNLYQDSIELNFDTLLTIRPSALIKYNPSRSFVSIKLPIDWKAIEDSVYTLVQSTNDSLLREDFSLSQLNLILKRGFLLSVEGDTSKLQANRITRYNPEDYGLIKVSLPPQDQKFILELIDKEGNTVARIYNKEQHVFNRLKLGEYSLRVKIDLNSNGRWDTGNILKDQPPEPIIYYGSYTEVRPNFEILIEDFSF